MRYLFLLVFQFAIQEIGHAASITVSPDVKIESVTSFTTVELWSATTPTSVESGGVTVNYRMLDPEGPIVQGKWTDCGLVMIGTGDIATQPVSFRVWATRPCELSINKTTKLGSSGKVHFEFLVNSKIALPIQVSDELVVTVSGKSIGRIKSAVEKR